MPFSWTGFYIGAHAGWGWGKTEWSDGCLDLNPANSFCEAEALGPLGSYNLNGFLGGGQVGYDWQLGWAVFGIEADASWSDIKGSGICLGERQCSSKIDAFGTITGRFGGAFDRALLYVKGGGAWAHEKHTVVQLSSATTSSLSDTRWGWTVGAGVEYAFAPNWSGKIEYDFLDFGRDAHIFAFTPNFGVSGDVRQTIHTVKLGLNYRFGGSTNAGY